MGSNNFIAFKYSFFAINYFAFSIISILLDDYDAFSLFQKFDGEAVIISDESLYALIKA